MQIERTLAEPLDCCRDSATRMLAAASRIRAVTSQSLRLEAQPADRTASSPARQTGSAPAALRRHRRIKAANGSQRSYREPVVPVLHGDWRMAWE